MIPKSTFLSVITSNNFGLLNSGGTVYGTDFETALTAGDTACVIDSTGVAGVNDLAFSASSQNYDGQPRVYYVKITNGNATRDYYSWSLDNSTWVDAQQIPAGSTPFHLAFGLYVYFPTSANHTTNDVWVVHCANNTRWFEPVDFLGLNNVVLKDIDLTTQTVSEDGLNTTRITGYQSPGEAGTGGAYLNSFISNVFTPYGNSSFKQLAYHHNHPVLQALRLENAILVVKDNNRNTDMYNKLFYEYPIATSDKSLLTELIPVDADGVLSEERIIIEYPLGNDVSGFANFDLNNETGINNTERKSTGNEVVKKLYQEGAIGKITGSLDTAEVVYNGNPKQIVFNKQEPVKILNGTNGKYKIQSLKFGETIFPKRDNLGFVENYKREDYEEIPAESTLREYQDFWKEDETDRTRSDSKAHNSQDVHQELATLGADLNALSKWPLDTKVSNIGGNIIQEIVLSKDNFKITGFVTLNLDRLIDDNVSTSSLSSTWNISDVIEYNFGTSKNLYYAGIYIQNDTAGGGKLTTSFNVHYYNGGWVGSALDIGGDINNGTEQWFFLDISSIPTCSKIRLIAKELIDSAKGENVFINELKFFEIEDDSVTCFNASGIRGELEPQRIHTDTSTTPDYAPYVKCPGLQYTMFGNHYEDMVTLINAYLLSLPEAALGADEHERFQLYYNVPTQTDKRPWYDTYNDYWKEDLRLMGPEYSNLAEFRISDSVEFYLQNGLEGEINTKSYLYDGTEWVSDTTYNTGFLTVHGSDEPTSDDNGELNVDFLSRYVHSDYIHNLATIKKEQKGFSTLKDLEFSLDVLKKPIPYMGFYPVTRIYQLAILFNKSYADILDTFGTNLVPNSDTYLAIQAILHHLMSPGVLLNAIKSGVAVNFPTYVGKGQSYSGLSSGHTFNVNSVLKYTTYAETFVDGNTYPTVSLFTPPNMLVPFEVLLDVKGIMGTKKQKALDTDEGVYYVSHPIFNNVEATAADAVTTTDHSLNVNGAIIPELDATQPLFEMANHNFLAETIKFFLHDELTQNFVSKPESEFKEMEHGTVYYMDVVLRNKNVVMTEGYNWYEDGMGTYETYFRKQRGSLYGYPLNSTGEQYDLDSIQDLRDPMYGMWTPPYFYGDSVVRISFAPHEFDENLQPGQSRKFTLEEILKGAKIRTVKKTNVGGSKLTKVGAATSYTTVYPSYDDDVFEHNGFFNTIDWANYAIPNTLLTGPDPVTSLDYFKSAILYSGMMKIDASVNLWSKKRVSKMAYDKMRLGAKKINFEESTNSDNDCWVISSKWETPILNFNGHGYETYCTGPSSTAVTADKIRRARGMWYDYGILPQNDDGIYLEIKESFPERYYDKHTFADINDDADVDNLQLAALKTYSGQNDFMKHRKNGELFGSLVDTCGFKSGSKRLGEVSDKKVIHEGVVVIPFIERDGKIHMFKVDESVYNKQLENKFEHGFAWELMNGIKLIDTSITKTYDAMGKFVIPPQFDYRKYDKISPFVMYIFDVPFELSQQDLVDIWQNVMPDSFQRVEKEQLKINHKLEEYEFFHGQELPDDVRFMIFKVKQKAEWNYYNAIPATNEDKKFKFQVVNEKGEYIDMEPTYSYNWPYDFLSIVELAKLDVNLTFEGL